MAETGLGFPSPGPTTARIPACYRAAQQILARAGLARDATTSARKFVRSLETSLLEEGALAFATITDQFPTERFGKREAIDLRPELAALERAVDRMRLRNQPHIH